MSASKFRLIYETGLPWLTDKERIFISIQLVLRLAFHIRNDFKQTLFASNSYFQDSIHLIVS